MKIGDYTYSPKNGRYYKKFGSFRWMLLFHHNTQTESVFTPQEALDSSKDDKYSILGKITDKMKIENKFEFLLEYPSLSLINHWRQSNNPCNEVENPNLDGAKKAEGYEGIIISMKTRYWGGLVSSSYQKSLLDGSANHENCYYAIATYWTSSVNTYPGPDEGKYVTESALWIRIYEEEVHCSCLRNQRYSFVYLIVLLLITFR